MNPAFVLRTGRLDLSPVAFSDMADLVRLRGDPRAYAMMLGGVRAPMQVAQDLAAEIADWPRLGYGVWAVRVRGDDRFAGTVALQDRPDGLGVGLRFAMLPEEQGFGYASEAAAAALRFGHESAGLAQIVAVARADNFASRMVLGGIGMVERDAFWRGGERMLVYESIGGSPKGSRLEP